MVEEMRHEEFDPKITNEEEIIAGILQDMEPNIDVEVDPPSHNRFYSLKNPSDPITVRSMTFEDEKILSQVKDKQLAINTLLSRCVGNIEVNQLLIFDKLFLLLKIRERSFGSEVNAKAICTTCAMENTLLLDSTNFTVKEVPEEVTDPRELRLPGIGKTATVRFPRVADEPSLVNPDKILDNIWRFVESIDGHANKSIVSKVIQKLSAKDTNILVKNIFGLNYGVETKGKYECDSCGTVNMTEVQVSDDFFGENSN